MRNLMGLVVLSLMTGPLFADAEKAVKEQLQKLKGDGARMQLIKDEGVSKTFPDHEFVSVIYPQFPVARLAPEPLKSSNVYAVTKDGKTTLLNDVKELEKMFTEHKIGEKEADRKHVVHSWLRLVQELHQDGFYQFKIEEDSLKVGDDTASGKAVVSQGGNGTISVKMSFSDGKIKTIECEASLNPGPRPRCHATLLLDANPLVRTIVEDDLLIMGRHAIPYLNEQHEKASGELKKAIDRVRQRILSGDR